MSSKIQINPISPRVVQAVEWAKTDLSDAVLALLSGIENAFTGHQEQESIESLREEYVAALSAVSSFLMRVDWRYANRFLVLVDALADLNVGVQRPIVAPTKKKIVAAAKKTKNLIALRVMRARAHVVFALDVLIDCLKMQPNDAAKEILSKFPGIEYLAGSKSRNKNSKAALRRTILGWRKNLKAPSRHQDEAVTALLKIGREMIDTQLSFAASKKECRQVAYESLRDAEKVGLDKFGVFYI